MKRVIGIAAMALVAAVWGCQNTEMQAESGQASEQGAETSGASTTDRSFITDAGASGTYEVQAGQLALQKSSDGHVRSIAQTIVDDHTRANNDLTDLCRRKGETPTAKLTPEQEKMIARLNSLRGSDFDQEFLSQQEQAHQDTIAKFQDEMRNGRDPDVRDFASRTLPTLQEHQRLLTGQPAGSNMGTER